MQKAAIVNCVLILFGMFFAAPLRADVTSGLIAHWSFDDGTATDKSGGGHHGTVDGATLVPGRFGNALSFDGNDHVFVPASSAFDTGGALTVSAWVKTNSDANGGESLVYLGDLNSTQNVGWYIYASGATNFYCRLDVYLTDDVKYNPLGLPQGINDGEWHHVVGTFDRSLPSEQLKWYVDNVLVEVVSVPDLDIRSAASGLYIGAHVNGLSNPGFQGSIDDVRVYSRALDASDIDLLYSGLIAHWSFDDGTATDNSGGGHHGTVDGATLVPGRCGNALSFDGNDYVFVPASSAFDTGGALTVSAWVKTNSDANGGESLLYLGDLNSTQNVGWYLYASGGANFYCRLDVYLTDDVKYNPLGLPQGINDGKWHHVVGTFDRSLPSEQLKWYVDKVLVEVVSVPDLDIRSAASGLYIGAHVNGLSNPGFQGSIDDVRVYGGALTASDINLLYQCDNPIPTVSEWGLIAMALFILTAGTLVYGKCKPAHARPASSVERLIA